MIDEYLGEFERWTVGTPDERRDWKAELEAHLLEADRAGELDKALRRLGSPREAAAAFGASRRRTRATLALRCRAAALDYAPLIVATVAQVVWQVVTTNVREFSFGLLSFPPPIGIVVDAGDAIAETVVWNLLFVGAGLWSFVGLAVMESRTGSTLGKRRYGLATISEDGTAVSLAQALVRRIPLWFGLLFWLDLLTLATERRQRVFELLARTQVVEDPSRVRTASGVG